VARPGPIYDNVIKYISEEGLTAFLRLLGVDGQVDPAPTNLPAAERFADLIAVVDGGAVHHVEFQTRPDPDMALRMLDYYVRIAQNRRYRGKPITQHLVLLGPGQDAGSWTRPDLIYRYRVWRLQDMDPGPLLAEPTLAPLAVLARSDGMPRAELYRQALVTAGRSLPAKRATRLREASAVLATLYLDQETIEQIWTDVMTAKLDDFPFASAFIEKGREQGLEQGLEQGRREGIARVLAVRFGDDARIEATAAALARRDDGYDLASTVPSLDDLDA
jgi:predicted transposase YdaD